MKNLFLSLAAMLVVAAGFAQTATPAAPAVVKGEDLIKFKETVHDFGKIKQGVPVTYDFTFTNVSPKTVVIESATASCGCTTPVKPEKPIAKGKSDKIKAGFNAASPSPFDKTIYVKVAGAAQPMEIKIKGEVLTPDAYAKYTAEKGKKASK
ncbi:MAG TPA: DUF1573 domain-containing protein [Chitinophagaceae bacterium]|nr:DUF1573 domain-containing protein [Chitinophagaceae bacterium]